MISWLNTPIDVTPGTQGAWTDVDHAAVPDGAKGVFLCFENNVTANPPGDKDIGARKNGSSDTFLSKGYWNNSPAGVGTHIHVQVGVDASGVFEVYIEDTSLSKCWLLGYWENDANVVMLTNAVDKTPTRDDTWRTVDIASDTGADTAAAAIITHYQPDGNYESSGVRKIGSANTSMYGGHWYNTTIVTLNGSEQFEARVAAGGASKIYLVGYLKGGWVDAESVGPWTDPTVSQAWRSPTLADKPAGATDEYVAAIGLCWDGVTPNARGLRHRRWGSWDVRRKLSKDGLHWMTIPLDRARKFDDWMYDQPNQYGFVYGYVKRTISAPAGGTALVHLVKEDYTERTTTSTTEIEVTQHTIAWADLTAAGFAAGDEVIIIGKACVGGASTNCAAGQLPRQSRHELRRPHDLDGLGAITRAEQDDGRTRLCVAMGQETHAGGVRESVFLVGHQQLHRSGRRFRAHGRQARWQWGSGHRRLALRRNHADRQCFDDVHRRRERDVAWSEKIVVGDHDVCPLAHRLDQRRSAAENRRGQRQSV